MYVKDSLPGKLSFVSLIQTKHSGFKEASHKTSDTNREGCNPQATWFRYKPTVENVALLKPSQDCAISKNMVRFSRI